MSVLADVIGIGDMLSHPFMRNAFLAGTAIAAASGLAGYFLVLRSQVFSADALSHVTFTGAFAALAIGLDLRVGLFASVVLVSVLLTGLATAGTGHSLATKILALVISTVVNFVQPPTGRRVSGSSPRGRSRGRRGSWARR